MSRENETAESCVNVPVDDVLVGSVLAIGCNEPSTFSKAANPGELAAWAIWEIVKAFAYLQLYSKPQVVDIRIANPREESE
jgi:hypothetical protein